MRGDLAVEFGQGDVTGHAQVGASGERSAESRTNVGATTLAQKSGLAAVG
jgi:hypothetical protein